MSAVVTVGLDRPARTGTRWASGLVLLGATGGAEAVAFAAHNRTAIPLVESVGLIVAAVWAVAGVAAWDGAGVPLPALGAVLGASGLAASRLSGSEHRLGSAVATVAGCLLMALWLHWLLALPGTRLRSRTGWRMKSVVSAYAAAVVAAAVLASAGRSLGVPEVAAGLIVLSLLAIPSINQSYAAGTSRERDVLRWLAAGGAVAADLAVVICVLHALVGWPRPLGAATTAAAAALAVSLAAGHSSRLAPSGGRVLVNALSVSGFTLVMSLIYLIVVLGLGHAPDGSTDRETLGLSMIAASIGAVAFVPARERFLQSATRMVYGTRQAPDEVVRTFGSRLTRAIPMDELLLQLAESLTKTMGLSSAAVYTGSGDVLERAASVPEVGLGPHSVVVSERERPVVTRAGVSGTAWVSVWLPALIDGAGEAQLRVAPIRNAGALLGLLVVARPVSADTFSEDDDRILADLAREVGLAFHNTQLDAALQTTLAELRAQAVELRESRARIVASGDAERRKVERNLHDGAQQNLVALAVSMRLARDMVGDPTALTEMLEAMQAEVQRTIQELRELAHGIYPPLLVDGGLTPALSAAASRSRLDAVVDASVARYPGDIEAAVYFCCLEALQNASKHAPSAHVEVKLWEESGGLLFTVTDDGPGFDRKEVARGQGFTNMSDRLGAIGGTVRWESEPGQGARVWGSVPLP